MQSSSIKTTISLTKSWKIWLPLSLSLALVVALAVLFGVMSVTDQAEFNLWAINAMIILIFLALLGNFMLLIVIIFLAMATRSLHRKTSAFVSQIQTRSSGINHFLRNTSNAVLKPFLWMDQLGAVLNVLFTKKKDS
jgi:hypothetical protein